MKELSNSVHNKQLRGKSLYSIKSLGSKTLTHRKVQDYKLVSLASI